MDLDSAQKIVGVTVSVRTSEGLHEIVPSLVRRLLEVASRSRTNIINRFGDELRTGRVD